MWDWVRRLFSGEGFVPKGGCPGWTPELLRLHVAADLLIWLAYMAIPVILVYFLSKHRKVPYSSIFGWFAAFIVLCGGTHLVEALTPLWPAQWFSALVKAACAAVSLVTVWKLVPIIPEVLAMRSPGELEESLRVQAHVTARHEALLKAIAQVAWVADERGRPKPDVDDWPRVTGMDRDLWASEDGWGWLEAVHPDDRERTREAWSHAVETGDHYVCDYRLHSPGGLCRWTQARGVPVRGEDGRITEWVGLNLDIHKERALVEDLESMAYVTSHDLKAPLRNIASLATWIEEDYKDLPEGLRARLRQMRQRIKRMDDLINGILEYSRVGRMETREATVDLNPVVSGIVDSLGAADRVAVADLPTIRSNPTRMAQVFQNLLANAFKHHPRPDQARVEVGYERRDALLVFWVRDDGDGIPERYHGKLFQLFTKLTSNEDSTGVGLALVKKIIAGKGGTVWVESQEGKGATFFFSLPATRLAAPPSTPGGSAGPAGVPAPGPA